MSIHIFESCEDRRTFADNVVQVFNGGGFYHSGGTSASTPIFSAIINRLNEERLAVGKGPIGFLNPSLYANPGMLNDITNGKCTLETLRKLKCLCNLGSNPGCNTIGFSAVPGWDPASGLGTPNYPKMLDYYLSLP